MTRKIASTCVAAIFGFALTAAAQTPPPSAPPADPQTPPSASAPMPQDQPSAKAGKELTGCVQAGTEAGSFELTNVKGKGDSGDKKTVKLAAAPGVDLATHVGHTVELSGSWDAGAPSASAPAAAPASDAKAFSVSSVKMVSSTCSTGTN